MLDLTGAYKGLGASSVKRGLAVVSQRRAVLVQDELKLDKKAGVAWTMITAADIKTDGAAATLTLGGKKLTARVLEPAGAKFSVVEAPDEPEPHKSNKGFRRLVVDLGDRQGDVRIVVLLSPAWPRGGEVSSEEVMPLEKW